MAEEEKLSKEQARKFVDVDKDWTSTFVFTPSDRAKSKKKPESKQ